MAEVRIRKEDLKHVSQNRDCEGESCTFNKPSNDEPACEHKVYEDDDD